MQKKGKDRGRSWYTNIPWLLLILGFGRSFYWLLYREPNYTTLKYGEFIQLLQAARRDPSISLQKVRVGSDDVQGEAVFNDTVSDGKQSVRKPQTIAFRTVATSAWKTIRNCTTCSGWRPAPTTKAMRKNRLSKPCCRN